MTDMAEAVAQAEDRSFAVDEWFKNLAEKHAAPIFDGNAWRFPVSTEEESNG